VEKIQGRVRTMQETQEQGLQIAEPEGPFEAMDRAFLILRILVLFGGFGWIYFAPLSIDNKAQVLLVFVFYSFYTAALYITIFFNQERIRVFYIVGLIFDLIFIFLLLMLTGGAASSFFIGFYILVALHSFYYGLTVGLLVSFASSLIYFVSYVNSGFPIHWTDFALRISFLFLLSIMAGLLTGKMKQDRERIDHLNQKLNESLLDLEKVHKKLIETAKLTALGRMTADVAHEIRNPLVTIGGFARRCNSKIDPNSPEKKYSKIIVDEVERLEKILRDLLVFSKGPERTPKMISIRPVLEKSLEIQNDDIKEKKIRVVREYAENLPEILGDEEELNQVFVNMILNAVQAMTFDGVLTLKAGSHLRDGVEWLCIEIQDTGVGIPEENLDRIFNPFFTTKRIGEGTGLGLSVSRRIVEEHQGKIEVESELGKGSAFRVLLPAFSKKEERTA